MSQFTIYENLDENTRDELPYYVDVQNDILNALDTRLVIPLADKRLNDTPLTDIYPSTSVEGMDLVLLTHQVSTVPVSMLQAPVGSVVHLKDEILVSIDFLFHGV